MCFGCSKEPSHRDASFEYQQHMLWLKNKKNNLQLRTLIWRPGFTMYFLFVQHELMCMFNFLLHFQTNFNEAKNVFEQRA